jgi:hypothetical protein
MSNLTRSAELFEFSIHGFLENFPFQARDITTDHSCLIYTVQDTGN